MSKTQLYRWFDKDDNLLYIGISFSAVNRATEHRRTAEWYDEAVKMTIENYATRYEAMKGECEAIRTEKPKFNRIGGESYLMFKEYGYNSVEDYYKNRKRDKEIAKNKALNLKYFIKDCELFEFYNTKWRGILASNTSPTNQRVDWGRVENDFNEVCENKEWSFLQFKNLNNIPDMNSRDRAKIYANFKGLFLYRDDENCMFAEYYCSRDAIDMLCKKSIKILEIHRHGIDLKQI